MSSSVPPSAAEVSSRDVGAGAPLSSRRWLVLVAMTGSLSMIMLDQTVVAVALPSMARELPLSPHGQQWVLNAYVLAIATLVALGGRAADQPQWSVHLVLTARRRHRPPRAAGAPC